MKEESQQRSYNKDPKELKVNRVVHQLKNIIIRYSSPDKLHDYLYELYLNISNRDQLKPLDKMIRTVCTRLKSAQQLVDHFVFAIKCLQSSTRCSQDAFSEEDFKKCLNSIEELTKKNEINEWINNIKKFIDSKKKVNSKISSTKDKKEERKMIGQTTSLSNFRKKIGQFQSVKPKLNQQQSFSIQATKDQIKERLAKTQRPPKKHNNQTTSKQQNKKEDQYSEKQKKGTQQNDLEVRDNKKTENHPVKPIQTLENENPPLISKETLNPTHQNHQSIKDYTGQSKISDKFQHNQLQNKVNKIQEEQDIQLIKKIFVIKNSNNLNFLKQVFWDECKFKIRKAEKIYSSQQMQYFNINQATLKDKNILLVIQLINGLVIGGFKRQEKHTQNQRHRGFMFSLTRKEVFPILQGNKQIQLFKLNQKEIIFGKEQLKINNEEMIVNSNFGIGKSLFNYKQRDLDYLIGEGSQNTAQILEYAIYQVI